MSHPLDPVRHHTGKSVWANQPLYGDNIGGKHLLFFQYFIQNYIMPW